MFQKVLRYTGRHRKTTYASILVLVAGVAMSVLPYFFLYRLLRPLLTGGSLTLEETLTSAGAMALCMVLYGLFLCERTGTVPPFRLSYFGKPPAPSPEQAGKAAPGRDPGEGRWRLEEDVH